MTNKDREITLTPEQESVVENKSKRLVVSASAGSGKTFVVVEKLIDLICKKKIPVSRLLVLTFTKAAASELKNRLYTEILNQPSSPFLIEQLDEIMVSDISTIDSFCEKVIKRNINKLSLAQNFAVLDEKNSKKLKNNAFRRTYDYFSNNFEDDFEKLYFAFKRNDDALEECVLSLQAFFDSLSNGDEIISDFENNISSFHEKACQHLKEFISKNIDESRRLLTQGLILTEASGEKLAKGHLAFFESMQNILNIDTNNEFFSLCKNLSSNKIPSLSTAACLKETKRLFARAKDRLKNAHDLAKECALLGDNIDKAKEGVLSKIIMAFYRKFADEYGRLKQKRFALDFADIEKYAQTFLKDDEVKKSLQSRYDYIFIDEYQDTNRLQESILKPIAEGGDFIAVGDIKQGIYGFRNASKEIMSQDIEEFTLDPNSDALFLRGNFRTDKRILSFVNDIFEKIMTMESVGIDYKETSMLEGLSTFLPNDLPPVTIDVVENSKPKKAKDGQEDIWQNVYSVKDAAIEKSYKFQKETDTILTRIDEVLAQKIYSPKTKEYRQVEPSDIALLFRSRSNLMQECVQKLQERGFAVNADIKENLLEDSEISLIASLIKLAINDCDDIPLASVMASPFGGFTLQELALLRQSNMDANFYEIVKASNNPKIIEFWDMLKEFKFNLQVKGIVKALELLFVEKEYDDYLNSLSDEKTKRSHINKLFALVRSGNLDFSPQELISQLENSDKDEKALSGQGNAITVTTIHATKGLEYPIVIICGGGESLNKAYNKNYISTPEFGLGTYVYSVEDNLRLPTPAFLAGKMAKKNREMVDELMLFYVAMTRAQNHLYIIGSGKADDFTFDDMAENNSYLKLIFFALGENFTTSLFEREHIFTQNRSFNIVTEIEGLIEEKEETREDEKTSKFAQEIEKYQNFAYKNAEIAKFSYKNSVTGATKINEEDYQVGEILFEDEEQKLKAEKAIEIGNSYHEALKYIVFDAVSDLATLEKELERVKNSLADGYYENIDKNLLLKNILLLKQLVGDRKVYKEREFIMSCSTDELLEMPDNKGLDVIVQGIVDMFAVGEDIILVDYKYTSTRDENALKERYGGQIRLYEKALKKAFDKKLAGKYLLSLKASQLINMD